MRASNHAMTEGTVGWSSTRNIFVTRLTDRYFLVLQSISWFVGRILVETVHVVRGSSKLEEFVNEMLGVGSDVILNCFAKVSASNVMLCYESQYQFHDVRQSILMANQQDIQFAVQPGHQPLSHRRVELEKFGRRFSVTTGDIG